MVGLPKAIIKKYGVSKKAWAVFRGSKRSGGAKRARRAGGTMAKRKFGHRHSRSGGIMAMLKPLAYGTVAGILAPRVPILKDLPFSGAIAGAAGGYFAKRTVGGAAIGAAGGQFVAPIAGNALNSVTGMRLY